MEESVKYANDFNCLLLPNLTEREMNIFMTILAKIKDGNRITTISVHNFKGYKESFSRTLEVVQSFSNKILASSGLDLVRVWYLTSPVKYSSYFF